MERSDSSARLLNMRADVIGEAEWLDLGERLRRLDPEKFAEYYADLSGFIEAVEQQRDAERRLAAAMSRLPPPRLSA